MRVRGRGKSIGPELCTECFKKCSEKGLLKFGVSLCLKSCRWKRSWWSWIESYGHTNCVITQQWTFFLPFYAFKTTTKSSSTWRACLLILKTFLVRKKKLHLNSNSMVNVNWLSLNKQIKKPNTTSSPVSVPTSKITLMFKCSVSVFILCGLGWTVELESVSLVSAYIHSSSESKCKLSTPPPLLPTGLRVPVKRTERSSNKSVSSACLGFNAHTGLPFSFPFSLSLI